MAQEEKIFADGFIFKRNEKAPEFVVGRLSIKVEDAVAFIEKHEKNGWVNLNIMTARTGNYYVDLDTFTPGDRSGSAVDKYEAKKAQSAPPQPPLNEDDEEDDLPF